METFLDYLETSSIGGFAHIKASKNWLEKIFWILVMASSWVFAINFISEAFINWDNDPIATTTVTKPIYDAPFPRIIVCPPKAAFVFIFLRFGKSKGSSCLAFLGLSLTQGLLLFLLQETSQASGHSFLLVNHFGRACKIPGC